MGRAQAIQTAALAVSLVLPRVCFAQASGQDQATAQALFDEGKRLMTANNFAEACPKLVESQRLDPGGGTLFAIALCHEAEGKTATAWADYNVALSEARKDGRKDREQAAADKAKALEPKLTKMRIVITTKAPGLELARDGGLVGEAQWGLPLPIDPGAHVFVAKATGKTEWTGTVDIRGEGKTVDVTIPALADAPAAAAPAVTTPPAPIQIEKPPPAKAEWSAQKTWAIVAGAAGVVGLGVGAAFGVSAISQWNNALDKCPNKQCTTREDKDNLNAAGGPAADVSTVLVAVGAGAALAGVILWFTAPKGGDRATIHVVPTASTDGLGVSFGGRL